MTSVEAWRQGCDEATRAAIDALRALVVEADQRVEEVIKWNAPSFALHGQDRITLGVERKGGVRAVLHCGAKGQGEDFSAVDSDGLARWPSPDRGTLTFADKGAVEAQRDALLRLFTRWLEATR